jgi:hypothetical protein
MATNIYHLALKNSESDRQPVAAHDRQSIADHHAEVTGKNPQSDRQKTAQVTGNPLPPIPLSDSIEDSIERVTRPKSKGGSRSKSGPRSKIPLPDDFALSDAMIAYAGDKAGWNGARTADEFEGFKIFHLKVGSVFVNWEAAWMQWVRKGAGFDKQRASTIGTVIDPDGNPVSVPPPWQTKQPFRRRSNADTAFDGGDYDY